MLVRDGPETEYFPRAGTGDELGEPLKEVIIGVSAETRGAGIGRRLLQGLLDRARGAGCPGLSLTVSERNPAAIQLYEGVGFVHHGQEPTGGLRMVWRP